MIKGSWLYRNFFIIYLALLCLGSLNLGAAQGIYQADTLDFVPPAHRAFIRAKFHEMMGDVSVAVRRDIAPHKKQVTLLSEACLLWVKTDHGKRI